MPLRCAEIGESYKRTEDEDSFIYIYIVKLAKKNAGWREEK